MIKQTYTVGPTLTEARSKGWTSNARGHLCPACSTPSIAVKPVKDLASFGKISGISL